MAFFPNGQGAEGRGPLEERGTLPVKDDAHPRLLVGKPRLVVLRERARAGDAAWGALRSKCDAHTRGQVEWPDGADYPAAPNLGEGYQGGGYFEPLVELSLCYQIAREIDPDRALAYADTGATILVRMSASEAPHAVDPLRDSGYGVRFYGVGMAIGYDMLHETLSNDQRARVRAAMKRWIDAYEKSGFGRDHPQGNYFAGYYAAKALSAIATIGDGDPGQAGYDDWLARVHRGVVQPYYEAHLRGGGWPEGWNYGPIASINMMLPALSLRGSMGVDLVNDSTKPFSFPVDQAEHVMHFSWPSRRSLDDRGAMYAGDNPAALTASLVTSLYGIAAAFDAPIAPAFHAFARDVRDAQGGPATPWQELLFWDKDAKESPFSNVARSFLARGMQTAAMRSSWDRDAIWASFTSGPYVNNPDSGEMYFDQGSLVVVRGGQPLLCNAHTGLMRHRPGTQDGDGTYDAIYADMFGDGKLRRRSLHNVFYVDGVGGQLAVPPNENSPKVSVFEDGGAYVIARGDGIERMYWQGVGSPPIKRWSRQITYLRPGYFVIDDWTDVANASAGQMMAFHLCGQVVKKREQGSDHAELTAQGAALLGVSPVLPATDMKLVDVLGRGKVRRVELRAQGRAAKRRWLTVVEAASGAQPLAQVRRVSVESPSDAEGVAIAAPDEAKVVISTGAHGPLSYSVAPGKSWHLVSGLEPASGYEVTTSQNDGKVVVKVVPGGNVKSSNAGVVSFHVMDDGRLAK